MEVFWDAIKQAVSLLIQGDRYVYEVMWMSLRVAGTATIFGMIVGIPIGSWLAMRRFWGWGAAATVLNVGLMLPPVVVGLFVFLLLSRQGPLGSLSLLYTPTAMIIAEFFIAAPVVAAITMGGVASVPRDVRLQAAGAGRLSVADRLVGHTRGAGHYHLGRRGRFRRCHQRSGCCDDGGWQPLHRRAQPDRHHDDCHHDAGSSGRLRHGDGLRADTHPSGVPYHLPPDAYPARHAPAVAAVVTAGDPPPRLRRPRNVCLRRCRPSPSRRMGCSSAMGIGPWSTWTPCRSTSRKCSPSSALTGRVRPLSSGCWPSWRSPTPDPSSTTGRRWTSMTSPPGAEQPPSSSARSSSRGPSKTTSGSACASAGSPARR